MVSIVYKHRHFINLGVCLTWDTEDSDGYKAGYKFVVPTFCGPHDYYSRKVARKKGIERLLKGTVGYMCSPHVFAALEMLDRVTPRDHKSHKWIKEFVCTLLGIKQLIPVQFSQKEIITAVKGALSEIPF